VLKWSSSILSKQQQQPQPQQQQGSGAARSSSGPLDVLGAVPPLAPGASSPMRAAVAAAAAGAAAAPLHGAGSSEGMQVARGLGVASVGHLNDLLTMCSLGQQGGVMHGPPH
jgi:hypothetical protein